MRQIAKSYSCSTLRIDIFDRSDTVFYNELPSRWSFYCKNQGVIIQKILALNDLAPLILERSIFQKLYDGISISFEYRRWRSLLIGNSEVEFFIQKTAQ